MAGADRGVGRVIHGPSLQLRPSDRPPRGGPAENGGRGTSARRDRRVARADGMAKAPA
ncbi:hypothetical protein [Rubrobacter tropicus]|uniref:hypothetical protein n=1 Tax=Rubrobacter tropicus TaxID=2653851 RepID=UPI00140C2BEC|nr:hypothetical protein [Rubrobacter tropicus]